MSAISTVVRGGQRRRVSTVVIVAATMLAVTAGVVAGILLAASSAPFAHAFDQQHGAHLTATFDAKTTTAAQAAATSSQAQQSAGPFPTATVQTIGTENTPPLPPFTVAGRTDPGHDAVDKVTLLKGRWATTTGEVVMLPGQIQLPLGLDLRLKDGSTLKVVGLARSVSQTAQGWVTPQEAAALGQTGWQMLYRYSNANTTAAMTAHKNALGIGAQTMSWLTVKADAAHRTQLYVPLLVSFGLLALATAALVIGNVTTGTIASATRRIGVLKAVGLTPAQVVRACLAQALIPGAAGVVLGIVAGDLLAVPLVSDVATLFGTVPLSVTPWIDVLAAIGALLVITGTAAPAAWRAARLRTVDALAVGRIPHNGRGRTAARLAARVRLPRPVSLGIAQPFSKPARLLAMLLTVAFGTAAATFAIGLAVSLQKVQAANDAPERAADVLVDPAPNSSSDPRTVIAKTVGAQAYFGRTDSDVTVDGLREPADGTITTGDARWSGYQLLAGRWYSAPGEVIVDTGLLTATGKHVGDTLTGTGHGPLTIVGEVFDGSANSHLYTDAASIPAAGLQAHDIAPDGVAGNSQQFFEWLVKLKPGVDRAAYISKIDAQGVLAQATEAGHIDGTLLVIDSLTTLLTVLLVTVAGLGVLNTVVLDSRDRVHDIGVHKSLGMTPRQTAGMVIASVTVPGLLGGALGVPAGYLLHLWAVPAMARGAGIRLPHSTVAVYGTALLVALALAGLVIAAAGALLPAGWAARTRTAVALRTE